jgi:hypothetical protein
VARELLYRCSAGLMNALWNVLVECRAALNTRSVERSSALYDQRFLHMSRRADGWAHGWRRNDRGFQQCIERAQARYQALGASSYDFRLLVETRPQPGQALGKVAWRLARDDGSELVTLEASYVVSQIGDSAKIVAVVDHGEEECLSARGLARGAGDLLFHLPAEFEQGVKRTSVSGRVALHELFGALSAAPARSR